MMRHRLAAALAGSALVVALAGCGAQPTLDGTAAAGMQDSVVAVAQLAANGDAPGATAQLDQLQSQLDAAIDGDLVTAARAARIQDAIDAVRADLAALAAPQPAPSPSESETQLVDTGGSDDTGADSGKSDSGKSDSGSTDNSGSNGNDNKGPGNNNGKGSGKSGKAGG
ncbi:hypothetical protein G5T42_11155 [Microbacterium sp. 4R-513]|uniref:hypothetical protein n=1 Tax=Microbacterium sp. 4R-513 TaxID=2567934 RepID=UPI0013E125BD|nr:hypothetical protein [Microbacterium sp. 4R-513]QIG39972.1 hypothetical protein G5T42_11155 [Microbacterium sp. 4R-513]